MGLGSGFKVEVRLIGVRKGNTEDNSIWDGLLRPGGAFFQIGLAV